MASILDKIRNQNKKKSSVTDFVNQNKKKETVTTLNKSEQAFSVPDVDLSDREGYVTKKIVNHETPNITEVTTPVLKTRNDDGSVSTAGGVSSRSSTSLSSIAENPTNYSSISTIPKIPVYGASNGKTLVQSYLDGKKGRNSQKDIGDGSVLGDVDDITKENKATIDPNAPKLDTDIDPNSPAVIAKRAADDAIQEEFGGIKRAGQLFDREKENLLLNKDRGEEDLATQKQRSEENLENNLKDYETNAQRAIDDNIEQKKRTLDVLERQAGVMGFSGYRTGLDQVSSDFNKTIGRIRQDLSTNKERGKEANERIIQDYDKALKRSVDNYGINMNRISEDFNYQMRSYRDNLSIDAAGLAEKYGLNPDKLLNKTLELTASAYQAVESAYGQYVSNAQAETNLLTDQVNSLMDVKNQMIDQEQTQLGQILANPGNITVNDLNTALNSGRIGMDGYNQAVDHLVQASVSQIDDIIGIPGVGLQFQDEITSGLEKGYSPNQILQSILEQPELAAIAQDVLENNPFEKMKLEAAQKALEGEDTQPNKWQKGEDGLFYRTNERTGELETKDTGLGTNSNFEQGGYVSGLGVVTAYGSPAWKRGLDVAGEKGSMIPSNVSGKIEKVGEDPEGFGNYVIVRNEDGSSTQYSHLGDIFVEQGMSIVAGENIGTMSNTGYVIPMNGGDGTHVDITMKTADGAYIKPQEVEQRLNSVGSRAVDDAEKEFTGPFEGVNVTYAQIGDFNDPVSRRDMDKETENRVASEKRKVMSDPEANINDILAWSDGGGRPSVGERDQLSKFDRALTGLTDLESELSDQSTGPIIGRIRELNPYDTKVKKSEALITGLIPTVARGVYGEVGVLTDTDIEHYTRTIPNLKNTDAQNKAILALNYKVLANGYKATLQGMAGAGLNVSGLEGTYNRIINTVNDLETQAGISRNNGGEQQGFSEDESIFADLDFGFATDGQDF